MILEEKLAFSHLFGDFRERVNSLHSRYETPCKAREYRDMPTRRQLGDSLKAGLGWLISIYLLQSHRKKLSSPYRYKFQYDMIAAENKALEHLDRALIHILVCF